MNASRSIGPAATAAYASGSFGTGVFSTVPTVLLLYFCTEILHIAAGAAALLVFVPKAWALAWDPLVGAWSDRAQSRFGRRRPFLVAGILGVSLFFLALFAPPELAPGALLGWTAVAYFGLATCYSLFAVPYIAIPAEIAHDDRDRAALISFRMVLVMVGVLAGAGIAPLLVAAFGGGRDGYAGMACVIAVACAVAMTGPVVMLKGRDSGKAVSGPRTALIRQIGGTLANAVFRLLVIAFLLQLTAVGVVMAATPYLITGPLGRGEADIGVAFSAMILMTIVSVPVWSAIGSHLGERRPLMAAAIAYAAISAAIGAAAALFPVWPAMLVLFALLGIALAGLQVLPFTLAAHVAHHQTERSGHSKEGAFTGVWTATEKLGLALGPGIAGTLIAFLGRGDRELFILIAFAPGVLVLASLAVLIRGGDLDRLRQ